MSQTSPFPPSIREPTAQLPVNESRSGAAAAGVGLAMVPIGLAERLVAAQAADAVLDDDAPAGEGGVVGHILRWAGLPTGLTPGRGHDHAWYQLVAPHVGFVAQAAHARRQAGQQLGLLQELDVAGRPRH